MLSPARGFGLLISLQASKQLLLLLDSTSSTLSGAGAFFTNETSDKIPIVDIQNGSRQLVDIPANVDFWIFPKSR
jgi:hypothetical protein